MMPYQFISNPPNPQPLIDMLTAKIATAEALCSALCDFLTFDQRNQLSDLTSPKPSPYSFPQFTPEMLISAQSNLEAAETKLSGIQELADNGNPMSEYIKAMFLPDARTSVDQARDWLSKIQQGLEDAGKPE